MKKFLFLALSVCLLQSASADPSVAQAKEILSKFSTHLVAGEYEAAFALRSDPFAQIVTSPTGEKIKLEVTKEKSVAGLALLKKDGSLTKINKHEVKIISTENKDGALIVTAKVTVDPGSPSKAFYTFKEVEGKVLIVEEEYMAAE